MSAISRSVATSQTADILFPQTRQTARGAVRSLQTAVCRRSECCERSKLPPVRNKINLSGKLSVQNCMALCGLKRCHFITSVPLPYSNKFKLCLQTVTACQPGWFVRCAVGVVQAGELCLPSRSCCPGSRRWP